MLLRHIVGSEARTKILILLSTKKEAFQREIELTLGLRVNAVQTQLKALEKEGAVLRKSDEYRVFYQLNPKYPLYNELRKLFRKAARLEKA